VFGKCPGWQPKKMASVCRLSFEGGSQNLRQCEGEVKRPAARNGVSVQAVTRVASKKFRRFAGEFVRVAPKNQRQFASEVTRLAAKTCRQCAGDMSRAAAKIWRQRA
jgi:hypothetical protein